MLFFGFGTWGGVFAANQPVVGCIYYSISFSSLKIYGWFIYLWLGYKYVLSPLKTGHVMKTWVFFATKFHYVAVSMFSMRVNGLAEPIFPIYLEGRRISKKYQIYLISFSRKCENGEDLYCFFFSFYIYTLKLFINIDGM